MKFHKQLLKHNPKLGVYGDCYRTCIACLLDMHPADVPHFMDGEEYDAEKVYKGINKWLSEKNLTICKFAFNYPPSRVLDLMGEFNPDVTYMMMGRSPRGVNHQVIAKGGKFIHDPHHSDSFIDDYSDNGYTYVEMLVPLF